MQTCRVQDGNTNTLTEVFFMSVYCPKTVSRLLSEEMEGTYSYTTSENYDEFLSKRGVPWIGRKLIIAAPVQLEVGPFIS